MDYVLEGVDAGELVQKLKLSIPVTNLNLITQLCHLLETLLLDSGHYTDPNVSACPAASLTCDTDVLDRTCMTNVGNAAVCKHDCPDAAEKTVACRFWRRYLCSVVCGVWGLALCRGQAVKTVTGN